MLFFPVRQLAASCRGASLVTTDRPLKQGGERDKNEEG